MSIPASVQALISRWNLGHIATVTPDGFPSVSPKGTFLVVDANTIAFGEIRSPQTIANIAHCAQCEVNFVDVFIRKGARLRGNAVVVLPQSAEYDTLLPAFQEKWGDLCDRFNQIVKIEISDVKPLTTPPYDTGATEAEMIEIYKSKFSEMYP